MLLKKTLTILRHAKAEPEGAGDHARVLAPQGVKEAEILGRYLVQEGLQFDKVFCSTSQRTRQTAAELGLLVDIDYDRAFYQADEETLLSLIAERAGEASSVLVIAHNPGLHELCLDLVAEAEASLWRKLAGQFPPASLAQIVFDMASWHDIFTAQGRLVRFSVPVDRAGVSL